MDYYIKSVVFLSSFSFTVAQSDADANCFNESNFQYCFHYHASLLLWQEAKIYCENRKYDLLTLDTKKEQEIVEKYAITAKQDVYFWINAREEIKDNWSWLSGKHFANNSEILDNDGNITNYKMYGALYMHRPSVSDGIAIYALAPGTAAFSICQYTGKSKCPTSVCFEYENAVNVGWFAARRRCLEKGGDLADEDILNYNELFSLTPNVFYWIGLRRSYWYWYEQGGKREVKYNYFHYSHPNSGYNNTCVFISLHFHFSWLSTDCSVGRVATLCEKKTPLSISSFITSTSTTSATLSPNVILDDVQTELLALISVLIALVLLTLIMNVVFFIRWQTTVFKGDSRNSPLYYRNTISNNGDDEEEKYIDIQMTGTTCQTNGASSKSQK